MNQSGFLRWYYAANFNSIAAHSVHHSPKRHGYETTKALLDWVKDGKAPAKKTLTQGILVDRSNFKEKAKAEGLMD